MMLVTTCVVSVTGWPSLTVPKKRAELITEARLAFSKSEEVITMRAGFAGSASFKTPSVSKVSWT